jgi:hypothetical protein
MLVRWHMFIRFVVGRDGEPHRILTGVVTEVRFLRDDGRLTSYEEATLSEVYAWLNNHLPVPPFSSSSWPKDAVAWFKDDAPAVDRMWDLVAILREHGVPVRMLRSRRPGKVLYEDDQQVVVVEHAEL